MDGVVVPSLFTLRVIWARRTANRVRQLLNPQEVAGELRSISHARRPVRGPAPGAAMPRGRQKTEVMMPSLTARTSTFSSSRVHVPKHL